MTTNQQPIRDLAKATRDVAGNLPSLPGIFPDQIAPVVRTGTEGPRKIVRARWGMPSPVFALAGRKVDRGVTNVRDTSSLLARDQATSSARFGAELREAMERRVDHLVKEGLARCQGQRVIFARHCPSVEGQHVFASIASA